MGGMTNEQYKGLLLDELEDWQEVLGMTKLPDEMNGAQALKAIRGLVEQKIAKINEKLKF